MTIADRDKPKVKTSFTTVAGAEFFITTNPGGYYIVATEGTGAPPQVCKEVFTNSREAIRALNVYAAENHRALDNKKRLEKNIERRAQEAKTREDEEDE